MFSKDISRTFRTNHQCVLENFANSTKKHLCWSLSLIKPESLQLYLKETPKQVFFCEICNIFKNAILSDISERLLLNLKDKFYVKFSFYNLNSIICLFSNHVLDALCFSLYQIIHVTNLLSNVLICIYLSLSFYSIALNANLHNECVGGTVKRKIEVRMDSRNNRINFL